MPVCSAILNYYFAASGNDSVAQMALGYRHMHGLRVPRSCQSAVLYYNPLAEQVVELARYPGSLPAVRACPQSHDPSLSSQTLAESCPVGMADEMCLSEQLNEPP